MRLLSAAACGLALAGCALSDADGTTPLTGSCFAIEVDGVTLIRSPEHALPPLIVLDSVLATGEWRRISEVPGSLPSAHRVAWWRRLGADSLELVWSTGFDGWNLRLAVRGDTLSGFAEQLNHALSGPATRLPASAARIDCAAEVPARYRRQRPPAPEVPLAGEAIPLRIGAPMEWRSTVIDSTDRLYRIAEAPSGPFSGADSVVVRLEDGRIVEIRLMYAAPAAAANAIARLTSLYGEPEQWIDRELWLDVMDLHAAPGLMLRIADPRTMCC